MIQQGYEGPPGRQTMELWECLTEEGKYKVGHNIITYKMEVDMQARIKLVTVALQSKIIYHTDYIRMEQVSP